MAASWREAFAGAHWFTGALRKAGMDAGVPGVADFATSGAGLASAGILAGLGTAGFYFGGREFSKDPSRRAAIAGSALGGLGGLALGVSLAGKRAGIPWGMFNKGLARAGTRAEKNQLLGLYGRNVLGPRWKSIAGLAAGGLGAGTAGGFLYGREFERKTPLGHALPAVSAGSFVGYKTMRGLRQFGGRGALAGAAFSIPGATAAAMGVYGYNMLGTNRTGYR